MTDLQNTNDNGTDDADSGALLQVAIGPTHENPATMKDMLFKPEHEGGAAFVMPSGAKIVLKDGAFISAGNGTTNINLDGYLISIAPPDRDDDGDENAKELLDDLRRGFHRVMKTLDAAKEDAMNDDGVIPADRHNELLERALGEVMDLFRE